MLDIDEIPAEHLQTQTIPSFFSGLVGGLAGLIVGHPFVKVRLQSRELASKYKGTWHCFITIIRQEKAGVAGVNALVFGSHSYFMTLQAKQRIQMDQLDTSPPSTPPLRDTFFAGLGAGLITSLVTCPMELAKVQLQNQTTNTIKGPIDCLIKLYTTGGIRMCFTGLTSTALRELSFGPYFLVYASIHQVLSSGSQEQDDQNPMKVIMAGGVAGIGAWCSTYAADVVKTRIQSEPHRYKSTLDCFKQCYKEEGWRVFFRGLSPTIVRAFPSNAATFMAYTWAMAGFASATQEQHTLRETVAI
ncbi:mitochondrial carrier domain-containing protein [Halteromyces radiatus]|uniref:mitochondrial carrier domain-containing protein n=1 Tax=Halteromyces radiatus TaxID=101107 RepID=UPI00221ECBCF|nr:mitochondrial carrier domain-containing protein [Halteromyces radiatus]KAI8082771.1 mitochondrial carrier domain-containing protein [Halteromyces radiatus]